MYRYKLEHTKNIRQRYTCPACHKAHTFKRYIDTTTGYYLADHVGRCNREVNCGYHYTPKQHLNEQGITPTIMAINRVIRPPQKKMSVLTLETMVKSFAAYYANNFAQFLIGRFGLSAAGKAIQRYHIGTSKHWPGANIFWQVDINGKVRTGKIMLYDAATCKRVKQPFNHISWVHTAMQLPEYELQQCFFGEHLLPNHNRRVNYKGEDCRTIGIVESEKTAVIASIYKPQIIWLACGSLSTLTADKFAVLRGFRVILFPDLNGYEQWSAKAKELSHVANIRVASRQEETATLQERMQGLDLADYLLKYEPADFTKERHAPVRHAA